MSETAKANRALCFSNAVSSWKWEKTNKKNIKKHYENGRNSRGGISFIKHHVLIQNKNPKWKFSYPAAHTWIPVKGTEKYEWALEFQKYSETYTIKKIEVQRDCSVILFYFIFYKLDCSVNYLIKLMRRRISHHNPYSVNAKKGKCYALDSSIHTMLKM
jgi:hypothetical protein